ncbi:hypothetical protein [Kribbella karoonensis]|uniref:Holin n=1 Tax=Kribbella karoonensis TaxID=324851 RepID=A0ABN2EFG3_9ACTN|nr:hypothetical protein [Kribbella sp.]
MDKKLQAEILAFVLLIAAFPITSIGTSHDSTVTWVIGLLAGVLGGLVPIWTRFMDHSGDKPRDMGMEYDDRPS